MRRTRVVASAAVVPLLGLWFACAGADERKTTTGDVPGAKPAESAPSPAAPKAPPAGDEAPPPQKAVERGTLRLITLPPPNVELPEAPGRETVTVLCGTCHTPAYITLQPPLSRETWTAVVTKMRTTYAAPIPDDKLDVVMDYVLAVRGLPQEK